MSAEKRSISAPAELFAKADQRKIELGYATFSDYIQYLLRADTMSGGAHLRDAAPTHPLPQAEQQVVKIVAAEVQKRLSYREKSRKTAK